MEFNIDYLQLNEEEQLKLINEFYFKIIYIEYPSEKVQLEAIRISPLSLKYINNPTKKVELFAVNRMFDRNFVKYTNWDDFVYSWITSSEALKLYYKLKKVHSIIK
jgi:hypothetical protein